MNDNVKLWTDALESGEYTQGFNRLGTVTRDGIDYCCLGVACEVFIKAGGNLEKSVGPGIVCYLEDFPDKKAVRTAYLPNCVKEWLGLKDAAGKFKIGDLSSALSYEQDGKNKTFKELAQIIKSEPEGLFC